MQIERVDINRPSMTLEQFVTLHNLTVVVNRDYARPADYRYVAFIKGYRIDAPYSVDLGSSSEAAALEKLATQISRRTLVSANSRFRIEVPQLLTKGFIW